MTGAQIVVDALIEEGVEVVFGYPGGAILDVFDQINSRPDKLRFVLVRHEQGAGHMADGYARATGKPGVVLVTSGPGATNLVTIDLSPCKGSLWGDCARSFPVEDGRVVTTPTVAEFVEGTALQAWLHESLTKAARPDMTFSALHRLIDGWVESKGFENLDVLGNFGHSIETSLSDRIWLDSHNRVTLGGVKAFTFEPHVRRKGARWGFKHENIYFFHTAGQLREL